MSIFYDLPVKEIRRETEEAVSLLFEVPEQLKSDFTFVPGQYVTIQKELEGSVLRRAYSICSAEASGELRVAVKEVPKGRFSGFVNRKLKTGDVLEVSVPEGRFVLNTAEANQKNYLAVAAGSGITPILSMIKSVLKRETKSRFVLLYGNKSGDRTIFKKELDALQERYPEALQIQYVYSQIISDKAKFGRIDEGILKDLIKAQNGGANFDQIFICGPEEMIDTTQNFLAKQGVDKERISFELFNTSSHKKEAIKALDGKCEISVVLDDEETTFQMRKDEFILDASLAKGLDAPYSCQGGICSSCLAKVTEGEAQMETNSILDEDEVSEGLILTCQARPVSDKIKLDFDDV